MTSAPEDVYRRAILGQIPRVIGLMDRDLSSPTAGCCDRTYWAWKFTDFPGARFQEAVCVLSFAYATEFEGNQYYRRASLLDWIRLALRYWTAIQYKDGSFDEAYPNERSLAATAFTTFYTGEALQFMGPDLDSQTAELVRNSMRRSGNWLVRNDESHGFLSNHLAAAAGALEHVYCQTGDIRFRMRSQYFIDKILQHQSDEGWYEEYGGADPGYQTHGSFYLARLIALAPQQELAQSLARAVRFQAVFIHPDRSLGGEYTSRNTQTYYPAAFEMLAGTDAAAAWIAETMRPTIAGSAAAGLNAVDAYNLFPMLNNLVFAFHACKTTQRTTVTPEEPDACRGMLWYPKAGIARYKRPRYVAYVGASKGGVVKVFDRRSCRLVYSDCGYVGRSGDKTLMASQHFDATARASADETRVTVKTAFVRVSRPVMTPVLFLSFRVFNLTLARSSTLAQWLKRRLVKLLIYRKSETGIELERTLEFGDSSITVHDRIQEKGESGVRELRWAPSFTTIHMGSSRYFVDHELEDLHQSRDAWQPIDIAKIRSGIVLQRTVGFE